MMRLTVNPFSSTGRETKRHAWGIFAFFFSDQHEVSNSIGVFRQSAPFIEIGQCCSSSSSSSSTDEFDASELSSGFACRSHGIRRTRTTRTNGFGEIRRSSRRNERSEAKSFLFDRLETFLRAEFVATAQHAASERFAFVAK